MAKRGSRSLSSYSFSRSSLLTRMCSPSKRIASCGSPRTIAARISAVVAVNLRELRGVVSLAPNAENVQQDARIRDHLQNAGIGRRTHQQGVKLQVDADEAAHSSATGDVSPDACEFIAQQQHVVDQHAASPPLPSREALCSAAFPTAYTSSASRSS